VYKREKFLTVIDAVIAYCFRSTYYLSKTSLFWVILSKQVFLLHYSQWKVDGRWGYSNERWL